MFKDIKVGGEEVISSFQIKNSKLESWEIKKGEESNLICNGGEGGEGYKNWNQGIKGFGMFDQMKVE